MSVLECKMTPEMIWAFRRKVLGGKSAVNGNPLPERLDECPVGVQEDHYAQACYFFASYCVSSGVVKLDLLMREGTDLLRQHVPVPLLVGAPRVDHLRLDAVRQVLADHGHHG